MFRRISYTIALQFTAFVFVLFLVNGAIFFGADIQNARRQTHARLDQAVHSMLRQVGDVTVFVSQGIPPPLRGRIRVADSEGNVVYTSGLFEGVPFVAAEGFSDLQIDHEQYRILTSSITRSGQLIGYVQLAEAERLQLGDIPRRAILYLVVSIGVSALTFGIGLFFARRSLKPAEQMVERLEQFTQDASHELRTPIAAVNSSLDLALKTEKYREGIESAKEDLKQVVVLVERLLDLARLDTFALQKATVDLSALVIATIEKHRALAAEKQVTIEENIAADIHVTGDAALLRQVLSNLLTNAIKFSNPEGGTIRVRLTEKELSVMDTGVGIPKDDLPHIFDRFFQADASRARGGFGLGLALVKRIVDLHGWSITAKSRIGDGTTFTIRLSAQV